jgi:DGQHR domain-containing protein
VAGTGGKAKFLQFNALRIAQRSDVPLFVFGVNGRIVHQIAAIEAAHRAADGVLAGYQRSRVERHIREIYSYLSTDGAILPNAIILALDSSTSFAPVKGELNNEWGTFGRLRLRAPVPGQPKPCLIIDGQQRVAALALLDPKRQFPVVVIGFLSPSDQLQREQFVLVNKTRPLPRDLLNELLPHIDASLPKTWELRRVAARAVEILRFDTSSPFCGRIRGVDASAEGCNISQAAVLGVVEASVRRGGILAPYVSGLASADTVSIAAVVAIFFEGVARVWRFAWNESPRTSRLVHGVGITAMGRLMDIVMKEVDASGPRAVLAVERRVRRLEEYCAWTGGRWPSPLDCPWNELQNTSQDKRRLAEFLVRAYEDGA